MIRKQEERCARASHLVLTQQTIPLHFAAILEKNGKLIDVYKHGWSPRAPLFYRPTMTLQDLREYGRGSRIGGPPDSFRFVMPATVQQSDKIDIMDHSRYSLWTYKQDGIRFYWKFLTLGSVPLSFLVNRKGDIIWIPTNPNVPSSWYRGTIFDLEVVCHRSTSSIEFVIHDCYSSCGELCGQLPFAYRITIAQALVTRWSELKTATESELKTLTEPESSTHAESELKTSVKSESSTTSSESTSFSSPSSSPLSNWAWSVRHRVNSWWTVSIKRSYSTADIAWLVDRTIPWLVKHAQLPVDGLIRMTAEDSMFVSPKKFKLDHPLDVQLELLPPLDDSNNHREFRMLIYDVHARRMIPWTTFGSTLTVTTDECPRSITSWSELHGSIAEVELLTTSRSCRFLKTRANDKAQSNDSNTARDVVRQVTHPMTLVDMFPQLAFVNHGYHRPSQWNVLRARSGKQWGDDSVSSSDDPQFQLPHPQFVVPCNLDQMRHQWKFQSTVTGSADHLLYLHER